MSEKPRVDVAIALVWREGKLLVARRAAGVHLAGRWEFPGGKRAPDEAHEACAEREALEETGVVARARGVREPIVWEYAERHVTLHPVDCDWVLGEGEAREVLEVRWVVPSELALLDFPEANASLIAALTATGELEAEPANRQRRAATVRPMALEEDFQSAKGRVEKLTRTPASEELLELYSLYKQATQGDVSGSRPGMLDFKGRAKYDAWATRRGMTADAAKQAYVDLVARLERKYG